MLGKVEIEPLAIAGVTLILQIVLCIIYGLGIALDRTPSRRRFQSGQVYAVGTATIVALVIICFSDSYFQIWSPMLGELGALQPPITQRLALILVFGLNYATATVLIRQSGGGRDSPFTPVLFLLPTLAIFLRQSGFIIVLCGVATGVAFLASTTTRSTKERAPLPRSFESADRQSMVAFQAVTGLCLLVTIGTGYITRPQPVISAAQVIKGVEAPSAPPRPD